jgi:hypothetical protein
MGVSSFTEGVSMSRVLRKVTMFCRYTNLKDKQILTSGDTISSTVRMCTKGVRLKSEVKACLIIDYNSYMPLRQTKGSKLTSFEDWKISDLMRMCNLKWNLLIESTNVPTAALLHSDRRTRPPCSIVPRAIGQYQLLHSDRRLPQVCRTQFRVKETVCIFSILTSQWKLCLNYKGDVI